MEEKKTDSFAVMLIIEQIGKYFKSKKVESGFAEPALEGFYPVMKG